MAVTSQQVRIPGGYVCDGIQQDFAVPWMFHYADALLVILRLISDGSETVQVLTTHYTVTGADVPSGGNVHMLVAPSALYELHIIHDPDLLQRVVLVSGAAVPIVSVERQMDDEVHQNQRTRDLVTRGIYLADTDSDGSGAFDARSNKIKNLDDPEDGQDAATKAWVGTQTIVSSGLPGPGTLTNAMWDPTDLLALTNGKGLTAAEMAVETDPFNAGAGPISPSVNQLGAWERIQFQLLKVLNWLDNGARAHAYEGIAVSNLPAVVAAQIAAALGAAGSASNVLVNGSLLVAQRNPADAATGTIVSPNEEWPLDRFYVRPYGGTITWGRASGAGPRHSASKSQFGLQVTGAVGVTGCRCGTRLSAAQARSLGMGTGVAKNFTIGFKFKNSSSAAASLTPTLTIRSTAFENDRLSTKFASGSKTIQFGPTNLTGAPFTIGQEVAYTQTVDLGTLAAFANGLEIDVELGALGAATTKATVSDFWMAVADISSTLLPDDFYETLEKCKRFYQKTFSYVTKPAQATGSADGILTATGGADQYYFQWQHSPVLIREGALSTRTTYSHSSLDANAHNGSADSASISGYSLGDQITNLRFNPSGTKDTAWFIHAAVDVEWRD